MLYVPSPFSLISFSALYCCPPFLLLTSLLLSSTCVFCLVSLFFSVHTLPIFLHFVRCPLLLSFPPAHKSSIIYNVRLFLCLAFPLRHCSFASADVRTIAGDGWTQRARDIYAKKKWKWWNNEHGEWGKWGTKRYWNGAGTGNNSREIDWKIDGGRQKEQEVSLPPSQYTWLS